MVFGARRAIAFAGVLIAQAGELVLEFHVLCSELGGALLDQLFKVETGSCGFR